MKIIDCFTFFNELDLLEFRLKLLDPYVDHFVIAESDLTHSGSPKPFYFKENRDRFGQWENKIVYLPVHQSTEGLVFEKSESYDPANASWKLENEQRNALAQASSLGTDGDLFLLSDLDEIPDPGIFKKLSEQEEPVALSMLFHYYFTNCQNVGVERWWNGTISCKGSIFRMQSPQQLRDRRNMIPVIKKAGWHFSYLGGLEKIKYKIRSFAHTEFNREEFISDENIITAMKKGVDIFKRPGVSYRFVTPHYYPPRLRKIMLQYPDLIFPGIKTNIAKRFIYSIKHLFT